MTLTITLFKTATCAPCKVLQPLLEAAVATRAGWQLQEVIAGPATAAVFKEFDVRAAPTVIVFRDGAIVGRFTGLHTPAQIDDFLARMEATR